MTTIKKIFSMICLIAYLVPAYGQKDTPAENGLYPKYNISLSDSTSRLSMELDQTTKRIGLTYKVPSQYIISGIFALQNTPRELIQTTINVITSQWIHKDGECILFIKCTGVRPQIDKSMDQIPENTFNWIKQTLGMGSFLDKTTEKDIEEIKKKITFWSPEKAKKTFNAQHVITYPINNKKAVYMEKYTHKQELVMIKWGDRLTVSFLVTKKGARNIDKYIKDVEEAFWFEN